MNDLEFFDRVQKDLTLLQTKEEIVWFLNCVRNFLHEPSNILEIGSYAGGNLCILSQLLANGGTLVSIEPELNMLVSIGTVREIVAPVNVIHIKGRTNDNGVYEQAESLGTYDVIFHDGDHYTLAEDYRYSSLLKERGIFGVHDIGWKDEPRISWLAIRGESWDEIVVQPGRRGIGVKYFELVSNSG